MSRPSEMGGIDGRVAFLIGQYVSSSTLVRGKSDPTETIIL